MKYKILLTLLLAFSLSIAKTNAQEIERSYTLVNPSITHDLKPGEKTQGTTELINESNTPLTFKITIQDYIVNDTKGTPVMLSPNTFSQKYSAASWISAFPTSFTINPKQTQIVTYKINVPANARPGGHYGAIIYSPQITQTKSSTGGTINTQMGSLFYLNIFGDIKQQAQIIKFAADKFYEYGPITILSQIKNLGDLHINPKGSIRVTGLFSNQEQSLPSYNIFPESQRDFENTFGQTFMLGRYKAQLSATYGKDNNLPLSATFYFWVFPWRIALVTGLSLIALILLILYIKKRRKEALSQSKEVKIDSQEL